MHAPHVCRKRCTQQSRNEDLFRAKSSRRKNKMLVINAIRNKLVQKVFACVRDKKEYVYRVAA